MFLGSPIYGNYLSAIGPKRMYTTGILVAGVCSITFGFLDKVPAGNTFIALCIVNRSLEGLGVAAFFTSSQAIIVHYFPDHVGACFAVQETFYAIGMMIAPTIGGALFEAGGFGLPFWVIGVVIFIAGITVMVFLPSPEDCGAKQGNIFTLLRSSRVLVSCMVILVGAMGSGFLQPTLANHMETYGLSSMHISLTFIVVPGVHALFSPLWGLIIDKWDLKSLVMILGLTVGFLSYILIGPTPLIPFLHHQLWCVYLGLALFGLTFGCTIVPAVPSLLHGCREIGLPENLDTFGLVCGLFNSVFCLGTFLGPSLGGFMVDHLEFEYSATIISGLFLIAVVVSTLYFCIIGCKNRSHHRDETLHLLD